MPFAEQKISYAEDYQIRDLAFGEHDWRIDWFGAVAYAERYRRKSQPLIEVQLSQVPENLQSVDQLFQLTGEQWPKTRQVKLPVGFLSRLRIGDIWQNGRLLNSPTYDISNFNNLQITRSTASIIKAGVSEDDERRFYLPISHHPFHIRHTHSYCLLIKSGDTRIVVPAIELIRFYFGSSSNLISRIFDAPFSPEKFWVYLEPGERGDKPKIHLATGLSGHSASDIGRIAFSKSARAAVELIGNSCIAATVNQQKAYPKAIFPFEGKTDLTASGKWLPFDGNERGVFLVFKLISCSHPFPFEGLRYTSERKGSSTSQANFANPKSDQSYGQHEKRFFRALTEVKQVVDQEPSRAKSTRELKSMASPQFPDLVWKKIAKVDIDQVPTVLHSLSGVSMISSSSVGEAGSDPTVQPIDLVAASGAHLPMKGSATATDVLTTTVFLDLTSKLLTSGRFVSVEFVRLDSRQRFDYLSTMPMIVDEDGQVSPSCLIPVTNDKEGASTKTRHRRLSVGRALELYVTYYFMVPESLPTSDDLPQEVELHLIADRSRSISDNSTLQAAIGAHFSQNSSEIGKSVELATGVKSVRFKTQNSIGLLGETNLISEQFYRHVLSYLPEPSIP